VSPDRPLSKTQTVVVAAVTGAACGAVIPVIVDHDLLLQTILTVAVFLVVFAAAAAVLGRPAGFDLPDAYWLLLIVALAASLASAIIGFDHHAVVAWVLLGIALAIALSAGQLRKRRAAKERDRARLSSALGS
jgi:uncharacterized membrane protein YoaK (UPF0700 family)